MQFEIQFNRKDENDNQEFYNHIEAKQLDKNDEFQYYGYFIELNSLEELEQLTKKINLYLTDGQNNFDYSPVISFDPPQIFLDSTM